MAIAEAVTQYLSEMAVAEVTKLAMRAIRGHWALDSQMPMVNRCWNKVRSELAEVGLLYEPQNATDGGYLDQIDLMVSLLPSVVEAGYVYEGYSWLPLISGYQEGVIYLPCDLPSKAYVPGGTLTDVIRHQYGHAWHWLEPSFFETGWFERAFGGSYDDLSFTPEESWTEKEESSRTFNRQFKLCRSERERKTLIRRSFYDNFVSRHTATFFCEDFAETFMTYMRFRNCLDRFSHRVGAFRKLKAVEKAVERARVELGT